MTRRSQSQWIPPSTLGRRGPGRSYDPFYQFERLARDDGKPRKPPQPKAGRDLLTLLQSKAVLIVMSSLLVVVVALLVVAIARS